MLDDLFVEVISAEVSVALGGNYLDAVFEDVEDGDVEGSSAEIEHSDLGLLYLLFQVIGQSVISPTRGTAICRVTAGGSTAVSSPTFTYTQARAVDFGFDATLGRVLVERGHDEAPTSTDGTVWDEVDGVLRLGGTPAATTARGLVSLPYFREAA